MANTERTKPVPVPGSDDPLVRALDGTRSDTSTPWFIRQARKLSATDDRRPRQSAGLKSVGSDAGGSPDPVATRRAPRDAVAPEDRFGPLPDLSQTVIPDVPPTAPTAVAASSPMTVAASSPMASWALRHWLNLVFAALLVLTVAAGWLFRGIVVAPQADEGSPRTVPTPVSRVVPAAPLPPAVPVPRQPAPPRVDTAVAVPTLPLPTGFTRRPAAVQASDRSGSATPSKLVAPVPMAPDLATERSRVVAATPRRGVATAARCAGLGRGGAWLVCTRPKLAALDRILVRMSAQTLATGDPRAQRRLAKTSARFLMRRNRCTTAPCVARLYERRLDAVSDYLRDGIKAAAKREVRRVKARG